jgi:hypothetical protein
VGKAVSKFIQGYTVYSVLFFLYLAVFIFVGFFLHIDISRWSLVLAFVSYAAAGLLYKLIKRVGKTKLLLYVSSVIITALLFWGLTSVFGQTYDTSYDGQDYHQSAVIELASQWNPIYQKSPPIKLVNKIDEPLISGYAKIIWSIDSSIYKLTDNIDSVTVLNFIVGLLAFSFLYQALRKLWLTAYPAIGVAFLATVTTLFVEQLFTLREDSLSYGFLIIGISSLVLSLRSSNKLPYFLCLMTALVFLAGIKDSDAFIFLPLLAVSLYVVLMKKLYQLNSFKIAVGLGLLAAFVTLFNPYVTNIIRYGAVDYPYNQQSFTNALRYEGVPHNLSHDGRLKLFYYGIFSTALIGSEQNPASNAQLKLPLTFSGNELLTEASAPAKLVGGYGVLFSGIFVLSSVAYIYLVIRRKSKAEKTIVIWLCAVLGLIIASCLLSPTPNYARYGNQLYLFPVAVVVALLIIAKEKWQLEKILAVVLIVLMAENIALDVVTASLLRAQEFTTINGQLSSLKQADATYAVHASDFYSSYLRLEAHGVKIVISPPSLDCNNKIALDETFNSTTLCKL